MKLFIAVLFLCLTLQAADLTALANQFNFYATQSLDGDVIGDIQKLAPQKLVPDDLALVKNVISTLMKLEDSGDKSRTGVMMLGQSYATNTRLYQRAFAEMKLTLKNKAQQLIEIEAVMKSFSTYGNG